MLPSDLREIAERYVPGSGPLAIQRLGSGLVNDSYRVARGDRLYSLRVPTPCAAEFGIDREWECRVIGRAQAAGLAPSVECCEPRQGILVARWVAGEVWTPAQVRHAENIECIAQLARRIHALRVPQGARMMSPAAWIAHYRRALDRHDPGADRPPSGAGPPRLPQLAPDACLASLAQLPPAAPVLCHSDLHPHNVVLAAHGPVLLDWEYAHVSDPLWDLAGWSCNNDLCADTRQLLLERYLGRQPGTADASRLEHLVWLYDYVCLLWSEVYATLRPDIPGDAISALARRLAQRLDANPW
ncbi:MAG TPA: choline/ethanolamine kinase family protein [Steroidobacteraceae bacterium]|nr:choline/ethanolamine kinase family protein [Steroidobacteraceae bacterium]